MPKVTQQYRDARRDQILSAARRCFLRDGFHATSMQDLFAEAGLSAGAVYRYFASKEDMIIAIAEENMLDIVDMVHDVAARQPGRPAGAVLADILEMVHAKHVQDGIGGIAVLVWSEALRSPAIAARFGEMLARIRGDLAEMVRQQQGAGDLPAGASADALAAAIFSVAPGYLMQLAILGPAAVEGIPDAVRHLWPLSVVRGRGGKRGRLGTGVPGLRRRDWYGSRRRSPRRLREGGRGRGPGRPGKRGRRSPRLSARGGGPARLHG